MNKPAQDLAKAQGFGIRLGGASVPLEKRRIRAFIALLILDLAALQTGFILAGLIYEGVWMEWRAQMQATALSAVFVTIALLSQTYSAQVLEDWRHAMRKVGVALIGSAALLNFIAFFLKANANFSRVSFTLGLVLTLALFGLYRWIAIRLIRRRWGGRVRNLLVIEDGGPAFRLEKATHLAASEVGLVPVSDDPFLLDRLGKLTQHQDRVIVTCPPVRHERWAMLLKSSGVRGEIVSKPLHALGALGVNHYPAQSSTTLIVSTGPLGIRARAAKRLFDIALASAGLVLLSPLLAWAALRIKLEDGGPVFFVQRRLGRGNCFFDMVKLRTMRAEAQDADGQQSTCREDERVTRIGRFLRATSIDELPQLWNVLRGEMSIVGPRPHAVGSRANDKLFWDIDARYWRRHSLRPGLTGLAQVRGYRGSTEHERDLTDRLQSDLEYISGWSLMRDVAIVIRTLRVLRHERAF